MKTLTHQIIKKHIVDGEMTAGHPISIKIDQTLMQDATGTMACLQLEGLDIDKVKTKKSVAYIDHNMLQTGPENADDHRYIESVCKKHGIYFSKAGNGVCHQVHIERFGIPGETLIGSDSHTPTCGGLGMLAIGAGGLDVAIAMAGGAFHLTMPKVIGVELLGELKPWSSAKDVILELLKRLTVKGGVGKIFEYTGEGVKTLSVPERATITNMGAELGATTSIFPSDERTLAFLKAQHREKDFAPHSADKGAKYDEIIKIDLSSIEPMVALPHSPDNVKKVKAVSGLKIDQVCIGSCTNSSLEDMMKVATILKGKTISKHVDLVIAPGSKQVLAMIAKNGALAYMISAGARILEVGCGPCIGMGQSPSTGAISLRTFNRNFEGRSGTKCAGVYLVSPETAAVSALTGVLTCPTSLGHEMSYHVPDTHLVDDSAILPPSKDGESVEIVRGPNIKPFPIGKPFGKVVKGKVLIKVGDNITTDHIMPSNAKLLPFRSNIPYLSDYCLTPCDPEFPKRAKTEGGGFIVAGANYGQGSSREHAALVPLYLGIRGVIAKSFARIHKANLINNGILPMVFTDDVEIEMGDELEVVDFVTVKNLTKGKSFKVEIDLTDKQREIIAAGGLLNHIKKGKK